MKSSLIDAPRQHDQDDLLGMNPYQDALIKFIKMADTPITIALQGEWGSGKTSLMNMLRWNLCEAEGASYYPVWINTWQYSLLKTPNEAIISILEGIVNQISEKSPKAKRSENKKRLGGILKTLATMGAKVAAGAVGVNGEVVDNLVGDSSTDSDINKLKKEIWKLIQESLSDDESKSGFIFFIDDLDRLDPPMAVEILELLKNIFDLEKCIFILAIDYDVVIKGLKPRFGELTKKNEREFRSFFDKIIQLPFTMPVASYNVNTFLMDALIRIGFFSKEELKDLSLDEKLSEIARLSVGCNPRSLKRLTNTLSLLTIINTEKGLVSDSIDTKSKTLNFAFVCIQIAYPFLYDTLSEEPNFKLWNEHVAAKLKLRHMSDEEKALLEADDEFNVEWESVVFRMCQEQIQHNDKASQIAKLLSIIAEIVNDDDSLGEIVESKIALSAVTNLKARDDSSDDKND